MLPDVTQISPPRRAVIDTVACAIGHANQSGLANSRFKNTKEWSAAPFLYLANTLRFDHDFQ